MKAMRQLTLFGFMSELFERKASTMKHSQWVLFGSTVVLVLCLMGFEGRAEAMSVTSLDFTSGAVNWNGRDGRILDRLFAQDGSITIGSYQSMSDIVDPITRGHKTFSLFTSGLNNAPAPSVTIEDMSITVDLSSLFLGWQRGDEIHIRNIGGTAKGLFNPETSEFQLSWDHLFNGKKHGHMHDNLATIFLVGKVVGGAPAAVPVPAGVFLFATGVVALGFWSWLKRRGQTLRTA
jgi:hypothetical protein